jgi:hypothetical protein
MELNSRTTRSCEAASRPLTTEALTAQPILKARSKAALRLNSVGSAAKVITLFANKQIPIHTRFMRFMYMLLM